MIKKLISSLTVFGMLVICSVSGIWGKQEDPIQLQDAEYISEIQMDVFKIPAERFGEAKVSRLMESLQSTVSSKCIEEKRIQRGTEYTVLSLIYKDGSKNIFYFFQEKDGWYVEAADGRIWADADFIAEYAVLPEKVDVKMTLGKPDGNVLEMYRQFETLDFRHYFVLNVKKYLDSFASEEEAVSYVGEQMKSAMILYQYAVQEGYGLTDEELTRLMEGKIKDAERAVNYSEIEKLYEENGITLQQAFEKSREYYRFTETITALYQAKREEFREGKDTVGHKVCRDVTEYWNTFVLEEINPKMAGYDLEGFYKMLDEAEAFYRSL